MLSYDKHVVHVLGWELSVFVYVRNARVNVREVGARLKKACHWCQLAGSLNHNGILSARKGLAVSTA